MSRELSAGDDRRRYIFGRGEEEEILRRLSMSAGVTVLSFCTELLFALCLSRSADFYTALNLRRLV